MRSTCPGTRKQRAASFLTRGDGARPPCADRTMRKLIASASCGDSPRAIPTLRVGPPRCGLTPLGQR
jgi:hypothetical protein